MIFDLSCLLQRRHRRFHRVDGLDQVRAAALGHLDGHGRSAVDARHRGRVLEGRLDLRDVEQRDRCLGRGHDRNLEDVLRLLEQRRHLDREAAALAFERAGGDERVEGLRDRAELVEGEPVARQQHGIEDDLDGFVAGAAQLRRQHARRLFDGVLGGARDAQQRALGHVAGEPHHQHRIEREVDLLHLRLVDLARQVVLGLIDLSAHVRERGLGVEPGLELEQHEAAALEGGRTHLLHVADRLELGLDRTQQQPLGILRADAALGELYVDDRNPDVRLRLLRDRHVRDQARAQQKQERRDGETRVTDGVVDEPGHHVAVLASSETCPRFRGGERSWGAMLFAIRYALFFVTRSFTARPR